jgi:hypothetical protein
MVMFREENAGHSHNIKTENSSFEITGDFKCMGTTLTNQILFRKKLRAE